MKSIFKALFLLLTIVSLSFCGDPTDSPEDCTDGQYFDQVRKLCFTCPALRTPECAPGCGFRIVTNEDDACPESECVDAEECDLCEDDQYFSDATLQCAACVPTDSCDAADQVKVISGDSCTIQCE